MKNDKLFKIPQIDWKDAKRKIISLNISLENLISDIK